MSVICPFCLSESTALPRCPACHCTLPNTQTPGEFHLPAWRTRANLRNDAAGMWLSCEKDAQPGIAWVGPAAGPAREAVIPEKPWSVKPVDSGQHEGRPFCVWAWPETTLPAVAPLDPRSGFELWSGLAEQGAFAQYREVFPWEVVRVDGQWRILSGRPVVAGLPLPGTLFAPERLLATTPTEKSTVFLNAAWFLFIVTGNYPVGLPTPISWKKTNLEKLDVVVFDALRTEPSRRPTQEDFTARLAENVAGGGVLQWVGTGLLYAAGAAFLIAWAGGVLWAISVFDLL